MINTKQSKSVTLPDVLTEPQIAHALRLYEAHGMEAVAKIQAEVIEPNMGAINTRLGQENSPRYLAYAVVHVFSKATEQVRRGLRDLLDQDAAARGADTVEATVAENDDPQRQGEDARQ